ncbi:DJ-1/PfpI family protein [Nocardiopsis sp. CNT-189]|uniref:DJ-1/PfpI family protein n=1 Tax=Nocardiopsis oceanisediminis TaxID=2816862 RepID=UPI003B295622
MRIVIVLFEGFTGLDVVGPYEVLSRLPGAETVLAAERPGPVRTDTGALGVVADVSLAEAGAADIVLVPGGPGQEALMEPGPLHEWLREADAGSSWTVSVCTGSLVLAAAGLLEGRRATTHWAAMDRLAGYGVVPVRERVVQDGKYVTGAGVSAGVDMALELAGRIEGDLFAQMVQLGIEYDPRPPYSAGSPESAPPEVVAALVEDSR